MTIYDSHISYMLRKFGKKVVSNSFGLLKIQGRNGVLSTVVVHNIAVHISTDRVGRGSKFKHSALLGDGSKFKK